MHTDDRKNQILSAIIEHFVQTAEPVGSKTIILTYNFNVSPATVRNDMAELEEQGLIMQPHTSAGRVPTDKGYRFYVDELADYEVAKNLAQKTLLGLRNRLAPLLLNNEFMMRLNCFRRQHRTWFLQLFRIPHEPSSWVFQKCSVSRNFWNLHSRPVRLWK